MDFSDAIHALNGLAFRRVGHSLDLAWLWFGAESPWTSELGIEGVRPEYALHVQCAFRVDVDDRIILGSRDLTLDAQGLRAESLFDVQARALNESAVTGVFNVIEARMTPGCGIKINLSRGITIEVFPDSSSGMEWWRLIKFSEPQHHFVFPPEL